MAARVAAWLEPTAADGDDGRVVAGSAVGRRRDRGRGRWAPSRSQRPHGYPPDRRPRFMDDRSARRRDPRRIHVRPRLLRHESRADDPDRGRALPLEAHGCAQRARSSCSSRSARNAGSPGRSVAGRRLDSAASYGVVTEPTELRVAAAAARHLPGTRSVSTAARSTRASAHLGVNPLYRLGAVLDVIKAYDEEAASRCRIRSCPADRARRASFRAASSQNAVPDYCDLMVDRRLLPGETVEGEMEAIRQSCSSRSRTTTPTSTSRCHSIPVAFEPAEISADSAFAAARRSTRPRPSPARDRALRHAVLERHRRHRQPRRHRGNHVRAGQRRRVPLRRRAGRARAGAGRRHRCSRSCPAIC